MSQISSAQSLPGKQSGKEKIDLWVFFSLALRKKRAQSDSEANTSQFMCALQQNKGGHWQLGRQVVLLLKREKPD